LIWSIFSEKGDGVAICNSSLILINGLANLCQGKAALGDLKKADMDRTGYNKVDDILKFCENFMALAILLITYSICDLGVNDYLPFFFTTCLYIDAMFDHLCDLFEKYSEGKPNKCCFWYGTFVSTCSNILLAYCGLALIKNYENVW
jgi:hypothetical protein